MDDGESAVKKSTGNLDLEGIQVSFLFSSIANEAAAFFALPSTPPFLSSLFRFPFSFRTYEMLIQLFYLFRVASFAGKNVDPESYRVGTSGGSDSTSERVGFGCTFEVFPSSLLYLFPTPYPYTHRQQLSLLYSPNFDLPPLLPSSSDRARQTLHLLPSPSSPPSLSPSFSPNPTPPTTTPTK